LHHILRFVGPQPDADQVAQQRLAKFAVQSSSLARLGGHARERQRQRQCVSAHRFLVIPSLTAPDPFRRALLARLPQPSRSVDITTVPKGFPADFQRSILQREPASPRWADDRSPQRKLWECHHCIAQSPGGATQCFVSPPLIDSLPFLSRPLAHRAPFRRVLAFRRYNNRAQRFSGRFSELSILRREPASPRGADDRSPQRKLWECHHCIAQSPGGATQQVLNRRHTSSHIRRDAVSESPETHSRLQVPTE